MRKKIKSFNALLGLKTIGFIEYFLALLFLDFAIEFNSVGWLICSVILFITGTNSFYTVHKDYKFFRRHKEDE